MTGGRPIVIERRVAASRQRVYAFLTDAAHWVRWQGEAATIEPVPGGLFEMRMANGMTARGRFVDLVENERVVFTWGWIDDPTTPPGSTAVAIELIEDGTATLLRLTHTGLAEAEILPHTTGWSHYLSRLAAVAEGRDPGPDPGPGT